jgi:predicted ArsR family transcriptional regulator
MVDHTPDAVDRDRHRVLAGASRVRVLEALRAEGGPLPIAEIAARVDLHPNTARLHLGQLVEAGLVAAQRESRDGPGRPRLVYVATVPPDRDPAERDDEYRVLAEVLVEHLERTAPDPAVEAVAAGRAWGRALAPAPPEPVSVERATADLTELLDGLGFAPRAAASGAVVELHRCPFRQVAERHSPVVCGVHLGLMQGALSRSGAPVRAGVLEPFATPEVCLAHLDVG